MNVNIKKLHPDAVIPQYAKPGDAGLDLVAVDCQYTDDYISYDTGLSFEIPDGYVGLLFPRSSISKYDLLLCNAVGVLDSGFRGPVSFRFKTTKPHGDTKWYKLGDKIGQLVIIPYPNIVLVEVDELSSTERGSGGYGHTGK